MFQCLIALFVIAVMVEKADGAAGLEMFFENITCSSEDPNEVMNLLSCYVSKNVKRRTFSMEMQFNKDVPHFLMNIRIVLPRKNDIDFVLLNLTNINGCKLLSNKNQATFIKLGRATLDRFGNMPHQCPFQKDKLYYIRGFRADMNLYPAFTFEVKMMVWFDLMVENNKLIKGFLSSSIQKRKSV